MVHHPVPLPDTGHFSTLQVRPATKPTKWTAATIALPSDPSTHALHYQAPPNLAAGFNSLHIAHSGPVRGNLVLDRIRTDSFRVKLETWGDGTLYEGGATWIEHKRGARDCIFGQFDTDDLALSPSASSCATCSRHSAHGLPSPPPSAGKGASGPKSHSHEKPARHRSEYSKHIRFPKAFKGQPEVVVWLNRLDLAGADSSDSNFRLRAHASNVSRHGFTAHVDTWADSLLHGAAMCWIAFPRQKKNVASGSFSTSDVRSWSAPREKTTGYVKFDDSGSGGMVGLRRPPTVLAALNMFDMAGNADLRVMVKVDEVTTKGFSWHLDTWDDSTLYAASASWIALA